VGLRTSWRLIWRNRNVPVVAGAIAGTVVGLGFLASTLGHKIEPVQTAPVVWVTSTIPERSSPKGSSDSTTVVRKPTLFVTTSTTQISKYLDISEICVLANDSPSGEGLVFTIFRYPESTIKPALWEQIVNENHRTLVQAIETQPCSERGNMILNETLPFLTEAEG